MRQRAVEQDERLATVLRAVAVTAAVLVVLAAVVVAIVVVLLRDQLVASGGSEAARRVAASSAERLGKDLGYRQRARDAGHIAATEVLREPDGSDQVRRTPVAWSGRVFADEQAVIDVRFEVVVPGEAPAAPGEPGHYAGTAAVCYRYTLEMYEYTSYQEINCPAGAPVPVPSPSPLLTLPPDANERLAAVLRTATPATLRDAVRAAFPQPGIGVDTVVHQGALVAAVSVPAERDCVVMVRTPDGKTSPVSFDRIQLEPGESGCGTNLYTAPVR